ncbi:induced myeloid leukemia cell differentiation protein Mcl-1-like [Diretmus argenteus]
MNIMSTRSKGASLTARTLGSSCFILPQHGVVEGSVVCFGSGPPSSAQLARASSIDSHSGNVPASGDTLKRPKALGVTAANTNGFAAATTKSIREDDNDGGSLPCTPDVQADMDMPSCPAGDEVLERDTRQLIDTFLTDFTGLSQPRWKQGDALATMKRVVEGVLEKHQYAYNGMVRKLMLDERGDDMRFVTSVATSLFGDRTTNWGRIASLVAFGAVVCQYLKEKDRQHCVSLVGWEISTYLLTNQRDWLIKNNAWDGFVEFFRVADPETTVRNTLMTFAGFAGIGATLALLIR